MKILPNAPLKPEGQIPTEGFSGCNVSKAHVHTKSQILQCQKCRKTFSCMKGEIRVLGIDDSPFNKFSKQQCLVIGTLFRGGKFIDGIMSTKVRVDGKNATSKLIEMIKRSKFQSQLRAIFLDGIALAGFNIIDIEKLHDATKIPVIVIIRKRPNLPKIKKTLKKLNMDQKIKLLETAGPITKIGKIYTQSKGITQTNLREVLKITCTHSEIPEALRISHLIAAGIGLGESHGDA